MYLLLNMAAFLLFGLVPALSASNPNVQETLRQSGSRSTFGARHNRIGSALVVLEFAPADRRPTYVGITNTGVGIIGAAAPLLGAALAGAGYEYLFGVSAAAFPYAVKASSGFEFSSTCPSDSQARACPSSTWLVGLRIAAARRNFSASGLL